jgi:D-hexose-6-phosphate mutarotase
MKNNKLEVGEIIKYPKSNLEVMSAETHRLYHNPKRKADLTDSQLSRIIGILEEEKDD